ncbi:ATP-dependent metallopeptidase Hfl [Ascodesmis nigricans]|uniref:ATP-dependent metallopeptidase Hfl n=1 Tax=Ascodesmis nigricans TaxID=341454 RepID=A0A4S2MSG4_9PEZI|nr:ATP-dependent metallopeptidase Hfl [Ascodesmis nigricans]
MISYGAPSQSTLYRAEQAANNNPKSATSQERFYDLLLRAGHARIVVDRYQNPRFARSPICDEKYRLALAQLDPGMATDGTAAYAGGRGGLSHEKLQAIGQGVAAHAHGGSVGAPRMASQSSGSSGARDDPIYVVVDESLGSTIFRWVKFMATFGFFVYISFVLVTLAAETSGTLRNRLGTQNNEAVPEQQTVRFSDVHGCDEAKDELQELVEFLKDPKRFSTLGGKLPKGVLLVGPPGTGKTLLARAVAGEAGVPFFFMSGSEFDEVYVGVGAKRVRELFAQARAKAPAIVFIDELDAIGGKRNERDAAYVKQTLNQLLVDLDGFSQNSGVIFLAATNFPQLLDKALTRPGRFDRRVVVPLPDMRGRVAILKHHMKKVQISPGLDPTMLASGTPGFSGAELENLVNQAAVRASRMKAKAVSMEHFDWARDKIMMGAERRSAIIAPEERLMTAYHEGGHAIVGLLTPGHTPLYKVTIMPRGQALGLTHYLDEKEKLSITKKECLARLDGALAGKIAEEIVYGGENVTGGCSSDISAATKIARMMICRLGMSEKLGDVDLTNYEYLSSETKRVIEEETKRLLYEARQRATKILTDKRKELDLVAHALVEYETLSAEEMQRIMRGEELNRMKISPTANIKVPEIPYPQPTPTSVGSDHVPPVPGARENGGNNV